jgi:hypothetical protein
MNEIKKYTAADFARYHAGTMPAAEMHALEKAALEDPFLEDALEGYAATPTPAADVTILGERLGNVGAVKKVFFLYPKASWWRVAALLVIMAGAGYLFFLVNNNVSRQNNLAKNESVAAVHLDTIPTFHADTAALIAVLPSAGLTSSAVAPVKVIIPQVSANSWSHPQAGTYSYTPAQQQQLAEASAPVAPVNAATADEPAARNDLSQNAQRDYYANTHSNNAVNDLAKNNNALNNAGYNNVFSSTVKDQNAAASNANVAERKVNAETPAYDRAKFKMADSTTFAKTDVPAYKSKISDIKKAAPANGAPGKGNTNPDAVVVTVPNQKKQVPDFSTASATITAKEITGVTLKKDADNNSVVGLRGRTSIPASGQTAEEKIVFDKYIKDNMQSVYNHEGNRMTGEVLLSFFVSRKGRPKDVKVAMSLCPPCEAQAIQLLENGPDWTAKKNEEKTVIIRF